MLLFFFQLNKQENPDACKTLRQFYHSESEDHLKIKPNIASLILLVFLSCGNNQNGVKSFEVLKEEKAYNIANGNDSLNAGKYIAQSILDINMGVKSISSSELECLDYNKLFCPEGLLNIVAYYDTRMNQLSQAIKFEDILLFEANYDSTENARSAFEQIKSDVALSNSIDQIELDKKLHARVELLKLGEKHGGLITFSEQQVFSLLENCEKSPLNKSWLEIEYMFTDLLKNKSGYVEVLKAGCEEGRYYGGRRKTSS